MAIERTNTERIALIDTSRELRVNPFAHTADESYLRDRMAASRSARPSLFRSIATSAVLFAVAAAVLVFVFAPHS